MSESSSGKGSGKRRKSSGTPRKSDSSSPSPVKSPSVNYAKLSPTAKKVRDVAADWHNLIQRWEVLNTSGASVTNKIVNCKLTNIESSDAAEMTVEQTSAVSAAGTGEAADGMSKELEVCCNQLTDTYKAMAKLWEKMEKLTSNLKGQWELQQYQSDQDDSETSILFQTWPIQHFYEVSAELSEMYHKELKLKQAISENIAHLSDRHTMMFLASSWLHQPYMGNRRDILLESMLVETGHR
ncbi:cyclin-dependent kinase 2-interacting protein-like [Branchiostoma lanceolatum]|uniref:cyclin-dependent kinase 2-interacting protein-like n=1 Tax=Branchiostoma lanceolatum TaxID=7740 RepID=UPI003453066E